MISHGTHFDAGRLSAILLGAGTAQPVGGVGVNAIHFGVAGKVRGAVKNVGTNPIGVTLTPDYRTPEQLIDGNPIPLGSLGQNGKKVLPIPGTFQNGILTSMKVKTTGSASSETHAAFLGEVDGVFTEMNLDVGIALFAGENVDFTYPLFFHDTRDLFIGIDLTQWLSFPTPFSPLQSFSFQNGTSDLLPGVLVGTAPVTLGPNGFESTAPFTGDAFVRAVGDGSFAPVPEPSTFILWAAGIGLIGSYSTIRQRRGVLRLTIKDLTPRSRVSNPLFEKPGEVS